MSDLEEEDYVDSDTSEKEESYKKLLNSVSQLDSTQRVKPASRKEISAEISEFNLQKGVAGENVVHVKELAKVLSKKPKHISISNKLKKVTGKSKILPKPLEQPAEVRLKREVGYESVKRQVARWNAVVARNALRDHLTFPLNDNSMKLQDSNDFLKQFRNPTPLEAELASILNHDKPSEKEKENFKFPFTLEEIMEKRKEMAHLRAQLSYREAKAHRQNKIKSKKYHRILKREKLRQQLKEFETLQKTDPTKALEKLSELDKNRALERASLRHRNTGQWAKNMAVQAKYDIKSRKILADQLKMSREITQKIQALNSSDEEESALTVEKSSTDNSKGLVVSEDNPWSIEISKDVEDFVSDYKKYWNEKGNEINTSQSNEKSKAELNGNADVKVTNISPRNEANNIDLSNKNVENSGQQNIETPGERNKNEKANNKIVATSKFKCSKSPENLAKNDSNGKPMKVSKDSCIVTIRPTSGVWIVTSVPENPYTLETNKKKRKAEKNINDLFNDLEEKLKEKATKKVKKINKKLKNEEKLNKKNKSKNTIDEGKMLALPPGIFKTVQRPDEDVELLEGDETNLLEANTQINAPIPTNSETAPPEIDPKKFIEVKPKKLGTDISVTVDTGEDAIDDDFKLQQQQIIEEAFGEDDVLTEFKKTKDEDNNKDEIKISTSLPGWGEWGGTGIAPSKKKKNLFTLIKLPPRKDRHKPDVIINENENPNIKNHLVKAIPHPFKSMEAFESNIRAPLGREWVPETAHTKLIRKPIETKLGTIIDPMSENEIIQLKKSAKSPYQGKKKTV